MEPNNPAYTILIIDDDSPSLKVLMNHLQDLGYKTLIARSGERGLEVANRSIPNLILLDILMPGIDGIETCRLLKENKSTQNIPVIFLTALPRTADKIRAFEVGAVDYVTKPIQHQEVSVRIRTHLRLRELTENLEKQVQAQTQELTAEVAERKQTEILLRESEEKYRLLVEAANVAIFVAQDGVFKLLNAKAQEISGFSKEKLLTQPFTEFIYPEDRDTIIQRYQQRIEGQPLDEIFVFRMIDGRGEIKWVELKAVLIEWEGKPATLNFLNDVTEKRHTERELLKAKKLESVGLLAGGIAHDFNNLLTGLFGNVELAKMFLSPTHKSYKYLELAWLSMDNAVNLTKQLLTFAKGGEPIKETLSIDQVLVETAQFSLHGSNVRLQTNIEQDLWPVKADKGQLSQVVSNLIINAQQAMPLGGTIILTAQNIETANGKFVKITVQDEGIGIDSQYLDKIFDPYFSTKKKGSGLGLASTHSIINKHNGSITVDSIPGQGSTFIIHLPATQDIEKRLDEETLLLLNATPASPARILLMDDEESVRNVLGTMLEGLGYDVSFATHGQEAIKMYAEAEKDDTSFDIVILDLTIPGGMGGQETAKNIIALNEHAKIVVTSGYAIDPIMASYKKYGFTARVVKPYRFKKLKKVIEEVLETN